MKSITAKNIFWQLFLVLLPIPITVWITILATNQPDNINYLDYFVNKNEDFINIPDPIKDKIDITYNGETIDNLSVLRIYIFNTTNRNLSNVQIHFEIQNEDKAYTLISSSLTGPDGYPKEGVHSILSSDSNIYIYNIDAMNRADDSTDNTYFEPFIAEFVFLGKELPEIKISTSKTGLKIRGSGESIVNTETDILTTIQYLLYNNWKQLIILSLALIFAVFYIPLSDKTTRFYIRNALRQYLEGLGNVELSSVHIDNIVKTADELYKKHTSILGSFAEPIKALIKKEKIN